jgi:hypothetical protein
MFIIITHNATLTQLPELSDGGRPGHALLTLLLLLHIIITTTYVFLLLLSIIITSL